MKRIIYVMTAALALLSSCKKTEISTYSGDTSLYFYVFYADPVVSGRSSIQPYTKFSFFGALDTQDTIKIQINLTGNAVNFDRQFVVGLDADSTTAVSGVDFEPLKSSYIIKANTVNTIVPVLVKRTAAMKTKELVIGLRLKANDDFKLNVPVWYPLPGQVNVLNNALFDARYHGVKVSDIPVAPAIWKTYGGLSGVKEGVYWGVFSPEKYYLMCQVCGLTYDDFTVAKMSSNRALLIATQMKNYLTAQFAAGTPVKETDGRLMYFYGVAWTSIPGVPY